ncbi:D-arabinose 1-dehydrogenase [Aureococcus anophagefferens]|nr:D-arabinose 1-dehydrogenase [Aureococcus anophagefferens]
MGAAASAQFGPTLDAEAMKPADGSDLVDYNAARAEAVHLRRFLAALRQQVANDGVTAAFEHRDDQGTWHRYAPSRACSSPWPSARTPTAPKLPGPPRSAGDFATSRKMATAPDTGMVRAQRLAGLAGGRVRASRAIANAPDGGTVVIPNTPTEIRWGHAARTAAHPDVPSAGVIAVNLRGDFPMQPGWRGRGGFAPTAPPAGAGAAPSSASSPRCAAGRPGAPGQPKPQQQQQQQQQGGKGSSAATNAAVAFGAVSVAAAAGAGGVLAVQNADQISAGVNDAGQWVSGGAAAAGAAGQWTVGAAAASPAATNQAAPAIGNAAGTAWTVGAANDVSQFATNQAAPAIGNAAGDVGQWGAGAPRAANWGGNAAQDATQWGAAAGMDAGQWGAGAAGDMGKKEPQTRRNSALGRDTSSSTSSTTLSAVVTTRTRSARAALQLPTQASLWTA